LFSSFCPYGNLTRFSVPHILGTLLKRSFRKSVMRRLFSSIRICHIHHTNKENKKLTIKMSKSSKFVRGFESICLHGGYLPDATTSRGIPLYRTAPYVFPSTERAAKLFALEELGNIYTRLTNPTTEILEKRFALLEGAPELGAVACSSGTAACFNSIINLAEQGDNFVSARNLYGGTFTQFKNILPKFGITAKFTDITDPQAVANSIDDKTRAIFCESVSNPAMEISPLEDLAKIAQDAGIPLIVDDTFTTPYLCKPMDWGANVVVSSLTKWTGGHGTAIGGIVVDAGNFDWSQGNHPLYTENDSSYGGLRWGLDLPEPLLPLAYILRMRTVPLRNLGACISPDNR
jgi:O-acetylhomoserine (thiol)-lyase